MTDYSELKRLAEAVMPDDASPYLPCQVAFMNAATPAAVLGLIAENERYRQHGCDTCDGSGHLSRADGEYFGACTSCGAYELEQAKRERDQLKAENERLRLALKSAEDAMWEAESNMDNEAADIRDLLAAMDQGEQSGG